MWKRANYWAAQRPLARTILYLARVPTEDSAEKHFARLTLAGDRFAGARLPIDALIELQRYREMVLEAARRAWLMDHSGQSIPEDFDLTFDLAVSDVEDGSATPLLDKPTSPYDVYYASGRDEFESALAEVINTGIGTWMADVPEDDTPDTGNITRQLESLTPTIPQRLEPLAALVDLPAFREFGSSLRSNEALRLQPGVDQQPVEVTASTASAIIRPFVDLVEQLRNSQPPSTKDTREKFVSTVAGRIIALNADKKSFDIDTLHYGQVHGNYKNAEMTTDLRAVLESSTHAPLVRITGRMSWRNGDLYRILSVDEWELLAVESEPWSRRVVELASLPPDWHPESDSSPVISFVAMDAAREVLREVRALSPVAGIFPREDGGVLVEWSTPERIVSLEISPDPEFLVFHLDVGVETATETETADISMVKEAVRGALAR